MMQVDDVHAAIVCKQLGAPIIKFDAVQPGALRHEYRVVKEGGRCKKSTHRGDCAHPSQISVGIENNRREVAASRSVKDIIVTQSGAVPPRKKPGGIVVAAALIIETGSRGYEISLPGRTVRKPIGQRQGIRTSSVKSIDRQSDRAGLLVLKASVYEVVIRIST